MSLKYIRRPILSSRSFSTLRSSIVGKRAAHPS